MYLIATAHTRSIASALNVSERSYIGVDAQVLLYGNSVVIDSGGHLAVDRSFSIYGTSVAVEAGANSKVEVRGVLWGRNISSTFLRLTRFARVGYAASGLAMVGTIPSFAYTLAGTSTVALTLPAGAGTSTSIEAL
jgi:hypothetical protein